MKKSIFLSILIIFVALTLVIVTPLNSSADTFIWSDELYTLDYGNLGTTIYNNNSVNYNTYVSYDDQPFSEISLNNNIGDKAQLPTVFDSNLQYSPSKVTNAYSTTTINYLNIGIQGSTFYAVKHLSGIISDLHLSSDSYFCFTCLFRSTIEISNISFQCADLVTGNAWQFNGITFEDKFLLYNPTGSGTPTSGLVKNNLWSIGNTTFYYYLLYFNVPFEYIQNVDLSTSDLILRISYPSASSPRFSVYSPLFYGVSANADNVIVNSLSSIDNNVQNISDILSQGTYTPPSSYSDLSNAISHGGGNLDDKIVGALNDDDIWSALSFTYVLSGATWVGTFLAQYYNGIPFLEGIYALILFFMICALLKNGALFKVNRGDSGGSQHRKTR